MTKYIKQYLWITLGVTLIAISYYFLFTPTQIVTGGVTGIALICKTLIPHFPQSIVIAILNVLLLIVGLLALGKDFFFKTIFGSILLPLEVALFELVPADIVFELDKLEWFQNVSMGLTDVSKVIIALIFGGAMMGAGLGLCYKHNGSTGGMDIIQKILSKYAHMPYSKTVYITDGIVVLGSLVVFGVERTAYALLTILLIGYVADFITMGGKSMRTCFIISEKQEEIKRVILEELERGCTVVPSFGAYSSKNYNMLLCTLNKEESYYLKDIIFIIDPNAFAFFVPAKEVYGYGFE